MENQRVLFSSEIISAQDMWKLPFMEKEQFMIWIWFEALWDIVGTAASFQWCVVYVHLNTLNKEDSAQKGQAAFFFFFLLTSL